MKTKYLITYDLNTPGQDYEDLYSAIKKLGTWWHYLDSTWIVIFDNSPDVLFEHLRSHIDDNDDLLIIEVKGNVSGWLPKKAWEWIQRNIPS